MTQIAARLLLLFMNKYRTGTEHDSRRQRPGVCSSAQGFLVWKEQAMRPSLPNLLVTDQ
jgi:hypothetical protein